MTTFQQWGERIAEAPDPGARRALLGEVARWRAQRLGDIPATRDATFAMSRLHQLLGEEDAAVREARSLLSLCHSAPKATEEEYAAASSWLKQLGEQVPKMAGAPGTERKHREPRGQREPRAARERPERPERAERRERPERAQEPVGASLRDEALELASRGDHTGALRALKGRRGPAVDLMRAWLQLSRALAAESAERRDQDLRDLEQRLRRRVGAEPSGRRPAAGAEEAEEGGPIPDDPLSQLLGRPAPRRRERRIEVIERFAQEHPNRIDELASAALRHHVEAAGPKSPGPWLAGVVAHALAKDGARTRETLAVLGRSGAFAVTAYEEEPFRRLVGIVGAALPRGWSYGGVRRGVVARGEPADRKLWTVRLDRDGVERMLVVAPISSEPYPEGLSATLAQRLTRLCSRVVLLAPGPGNASLREAAAALGLRTFGDDSGDEALLDALAEARAVEPAADERPERPRREERVEGRAEPAGPKPDAELAEALERGAGHEELVPIVQRFKRRFRAIQAAERALGDRPDDVRVVSLLRAIDVAAEPGESLPEGTTLAVRAAAHGGKESRAALTEPPLAERFGGPGVDVVAELAEAVVSAGWDIHRVLRGSTRREQREHGVLETLSDQLQGVWRLLVRKGEVRGEVWYIAELPIEGRAALPQLLLEERQRAVVLPIPGTGLSRDPGLLEWYGTLRGPDAIGWTGGEGDALRTELETWTAAD